MSHRNNPLDPVWLTSMLDCRDNTMSWLGSPQQPSSTATLSLETQHYHRSSAVLLQKSTMVLSGSIAPPSACCNEFRAEYDKSCLNSALLITCLCLAYVLARMQTILNAQNNPLPIHHVIKQAPMLPEIMLLANDAAMIGGLFTPGEGT